MNLAAIEDMNRKFPHAELCFIESGGDKGGPGITRSDLLVINKIDLAPQVGANLDVMEADALRMRVERPFLLTNLNSGEGVDQIAEFVIEKGGLAKESDTLTRYGEV